MSEVRYYKELYKPEISKPRAYKSVCSTEIIETFEEKDISDKMEILCILI